MADIYLGSTDLSSATFYLGSDAVSALYQGSTELWTSGPAYVTDGLLQYIDPFASTIGGGTASDLSGNANDATLGNSIAVTGTIGDTDSGWRLNATGGSAKYLDLGLNGADLSGGVTFEVFFKVVAGSSYDSEPSFVGFRQLSPSVYVGGVGAKASGENFEGYGLIEGPSTFNDLRDDTISVKDSTWHHWVVTYNGTSTTVYYKDTSVVATGTNAVGTLNTSNMKVFAGGPVATNQSIGFSRGFSDAYMGLTRIYTRALTSDEVLQNYNANKADYGL